MPLLRTRRPGRPFARLLLWLALCVAAPAFAAPAMLGLGSGEPAAAAAPLEQILKDAETASQATAAARQQLATLRAEAANAPARARELSAQLQADPQKAFAQWQARLPADADVETLELLLERERNDANQLRSQIEALTSALTSTLSQAADPGLAAADRQRRIDELSAPVVALEGEPADVTAARRQRNAAQRDQLLAERDLDDAVQELSGTRQRLQELELRALRHALALHEPRMLELERRISAISRAELASLEQGLAAAAAAAEGGDPVLVQATARNQALGKELLDASQGLSRMRRDLVVQDQALQRDQGALRDSLTRLELGGRSEQIGAWLWAELRRLEPERSLRDQLSEVRKQLGELRLRQISLGEAQRDLADLGAAAQKLRADHAVQQDDDGAEDDAGAVDPLLEALRRRQDLVERLQPLVWRSISTLEQFERSLTQRIDVNATLHQTLNQHLLWIRSHPPVDAAWLSSVPDGLYDLVKPARFATTARLVHDSLGERPLAYLASLLAVVLLLAARRRAPARLEQLAQSIRDARKDRYRRTLESLAWTVVAPMAGPAALFLFGNLLRGVGESGKYSDSLGLACMFAAMPLYLFGFIGWLARDRGLAHAHFRWTRPRRETLQAWAWRLQAGLTPLFFVISLAFVRNQDLAIAVQARLAIVAASLMLATAAWHALAPDRITHRRNAHEPSYLRKALRGAMPVCSVLGAILALDGYVYTIAILQQSLVHTFGVLVVVSVVHGMVARWFVLGARRLALHRYEQKRAAAAAAKGVGDVSEAGEAIALDTEAGLDLDMVNEQTSRLLRALGLSLLVLGLAWVWAGILPAFARLDDIVLWYVSDVGVDGDKIQAPVTLLGVLLGSATLVLTLIAARNLPGLLEIGLLTRVNMDAASRYAATSVSRYAIVMIGVVIGLGLLGLRWSQLQWLAAALTVGLGFGLQEIFANFVSGLILLFERPFRVGDVVTVNNYDGTVTRIRTRATTLLDFDNKEIVVPNKTFITGQLVNWTLSNETTRITLKVGTAYGTDPALVHRLLLQAAHESPRVIKDPAPSSWLLEFGASSLDFELRVFVIAMSDRLATRNQINMRIIELFAENGIEIAFPQLDLHVRDLPPVPGDAAAPEDPRQA